MRYFLEPITLTQVILHAVDKKDFVAFCNEHPNALNITLQEYNRLKATENNSIVTPKHIADAISYKMKLEAIFPKNIK